MKTFSSLKELLEYCKYCPTCKNTRELNISIGPDTKFKSIDFEIIDNKLIINTTFKYKQEASSESIVADLHKAIVMTFCVSTFNIQYTVDCENNNYERCVVSGSRNVAHDLVLDEVDKEDFCCWIYSNCACNCSVNTLDVEFNPVTKKITNIGIEQEAVWLTNTPHMFHISLHPKENQMQVTRLIRDEAGDLLDNSNVIKLPYTKIDFSDEIHAVNRIRTMIVFS